MGKAAALLLALAVLCSGCAQRETQREASRTAAREADWLWTQQLDNGAFAYDYEEDGSVYVNPYFSTEAALALIGHGESADRLENVCAYFDWYFSHLNSAEEDINHLSGTIYDYDMTVSDGHVTDERPRRDYDSTDSYAALFLLALDRYAAAGGNTEELVSHKEDIDRIVSVIFATMKNGYTYCRPDYEEYYLMDNCEVYAGLKGGAHLYAEVLEDPEGAERLKASAAFYDENFAADWWDGDHFTACLGDESFSWEEFYQSASSQAFPVIYGLIAPESETAQELYRTFCSHWDWPDMCYISSGDTEYCWGQLLVWGVMMHDEAGAARYIERYKEMTAAGHHYPVYCADAAMILIACDAQCMRGGA